MALDSKQKSSSSISSETVPYKFGATIEHHEDYSPSDCEKNDPGQLEHAPEGTASLGKTIFMVLKAFVGTGVVFLPGSFVSGGLIFSICLLIFISIVCTISIHLLVTTRSKIGGTYGGIGESLYGRWMRYAIAFFVALTQMGFVASYMIFISTNIGIAIDTLTECHAAFDSKYIIWMAILVIIPMTWIRKIGRLSWIVIIADTCILFCLIVVLYYCSDKIAREGAGPNIIMMNSNDFALMIGTAVFAFEGIAMVVPIVEGMKKPEKFPLAVNIGMGIITVVFIIIGTIGYVAFGDQTKASVIFNLPQTALSSTTQIVYSCGMLFSSPFMLYPVIVSLEKSLFRDRSGKLHFKWKWLKNLTRSMVALVCAAVSFGVGADSLDKFVSLVGSVACMPLCFIFPAMFHYKVTNGTWKKGGDILLGVFGAAVMVYTMYVNINSWVHPSPKAPAAVCGA
ncbi:transmembrane amino acid transporter protein-domain-containing protein [Phycomyces blakesleeanus]|uniref:Amino acid transporter transmembrane domain-containing protein n=2 Tax=Phycomyces blakesleeanus TaxID=4837 RepID=A0A167K320_PHYB8|nr:hypothetical protein PHYBLDRAFT_22486 [Phycomyces blakesleeanus NRRL 1555(-)]OAD67170.1 hypothetical protein PHYBLDRAFT_22486 [Phycomyces blakesleeanus NRRL 1555(-)]|eukprot:XP_018285210.1 hypothetical protein PHYBLDRAFT_22486 [Phycomyces blakesleeanus NRRL 1555(-)]